MKRLAAIIALGLSVACAATPPETAPTRAPATNGARTLAFTAPEARGGTVNGQDFVGKDVAVWLWAPW